MIARRKYSQSEIHTFLKCGKLWEFRYLRGLRRPPQTALTVGSSVDTAVSANLAQKIDSGTDLSTEEVLDHYSTDFDFRSEETEWGEEDPGKQKDLGAKLVALHHKEVAPKILPETVQQSFTIETDAGYAIQGVIDFTEKSGVVVDTKTARSAYAEKALEKAIQPALYDYAYEAVNGAPSKGFRFDVLIKPTTRTPARIQQLEGQVRQSDREWLFETISQVDKAIQAGVALPAPEGSWYCSREWCGFWNICKGKKR